MTTRQASVDFPEAQVAIYGLALSLDAFLLNGIPYGVLHQAVFPDFLQKTAGNVTRDLALLEEQVAHRPAGGQSETAELLATLRSRCQELIDLVTGLRSFAALSLEQVREAVCEIRRTRSECVQLIEHLEAYLGTPKPFYQSRPSHSTAAMNDFLANLERVLTEAWAAEKAE